MGRRSEGRSNLATYVAVAVALAILIGLPVLVLKSMDTPLVYKDKWLYVIALAHIQASMLCLYFLCANGPRERWRILSRLERAFAGSFFVAGPTLISYVVSLLFPLLASSLSDDVGDRDFVFVSSAPYARASRGLVQSKLLDANAVEHSVVFRKERMERLGLKCGDIVTTHGRSSFLGYVIDRESKSGGAVGRCPQD